MKRLVVGMTAHVDSGKTTLSEAMLYTAGELRRLGRVDKGDAFLDTHSIERSRGITVFSKQAVMGYGGSILFWIPPDTRTFLRKPSGRSASLT